MFGFSRQSVVFSPTQKRLLRELVIQEDSPGTILRDFEALLDYIQESEVLLTATQQLSLQALSEINARLAHPLQLGLKRPVQKSYPHIHGLYLLLRASGLTTVAGTGSKLALQVDEALYQAWENLNPTERYGTLLEAWFLRGRPEIVGERERPYLIPENFPRSLSFVNQIPDEGAPVAGTELEDGLRYTPGWHNLGLLELFGIIEVQHGPPEAGKGWQIDRVSRTIFGDALLALLYNELLGDFDRLMELEDEGEVPSGVLRPLVQPYFLEWQNDLPSPDTSFREGTHIFKISLAGSWCRIAIPASSDLDTLAHIILDAVDFDHDHLYQFSYRTRFGTIRNANHPYMDEGPSATEVLVGEVPLSIGEKMDYLFDFGDYWEFELTLESVDTDTVLDKPQVLETEGEPPEQYPQWDDWE